MKNNTVLIIASAILISSPVQANDWNVSVFGGRHDAGNLKWDDAKYKTDRGDSYGIGVSRQVAPRLHVGGEVSHTKNQYSNFKPNNITATSAMATAKYDLVQQGHFSAYAGAGVGVSHIRYKNNANGHKHTDNVASAQASLGARYHVSPQTKLFVEARRVEALSDPKVAHSGGSGSLQPAEYKGNSVLLGVTYSW